MVKNRNTIIIDTCDCQNQVMIIPNENSDLIYALTYRPLMKELAVGFNSNHQKYMYIYENVESVDFAKMLNSESFGSYLIHNIIKTHKVRKFNENTCEYEHCKQPKNFE